MVLLTLVCQKWDHLDVENIYLVLCGLNGEITLFIKPLIRSCAVGLSKFEIMTCLTAVKVFQADPVHYACVGEDHIL